LAERLNLTLIGFLRGDDCVLYTHGEHLIPDSPRRGNHKVYALMEKFA
jgi:hypothetical protein